MSVEKAEKKEPIKKKRPEKVVLINVENTCYPSITRNAKRLGWKITESDTKALLFWYDNNVTVEVCLSLLPWQFINHIPGTYCISRKIDLARNIERIQRILPKVFTFHPKSFALPAQNLDLQQYMASVSLKDKTFIIKPDLGAQGKGIYLIQDPEDVEGIGELAIAQQYIAPHLLDGYKFDLRIYVLVSSIDPLRIYTFHEGMARFCTEPYQKPRPGNLDQIYRHLTNYSLNKKNDKFSQPTEKDSTDGFKRSFSSVLDQMKSEGVDIEKIKESIHDLIVLTILSVHSFLKHTVKTSFRVNDGKSRCFEIMGFDIMIDKKLKPWLLEVNHSPSLHCDSPFDKELKDSVISGTMKIMNINPKFKKIVTDQEKLRTQQRITGASKSTQKSNFNAEKETEISKETGWMLLYPSEDPEKQSFYDSVLQAEATLSPIGTEENAATKHRREAIQAQLKKKEESEKLENEIMNKKKKVSKPKPDSDLQAPVVTQKPSLPNRTPRSVQLLREAKMARIRSEQLREAKAKQQQLTFPDSDDVPLSYDSPQMPPQPQVHGIAVYTRQMPHVTKPKVTPKNVVLDLGI